MNTTLRKGISFILAATMLVSLTACNPKKEAKVVKVSEDDPYYSVKEIEIYKAANVNDSVYVNSVLDLGDKIGIQIEVYKYSDMYYEEIPATTEVIAFDETVEEIDSADNSSEDVVSADESEEATVDDEDAVSDEEIPPEETGETTIVDDDSYDDMFQKLFIMFDLDGKKVGEFDLNKLMTMNDYVLSIKADSQGNLVMIIQSYDPQTWAGSYSLLTLDMDGKEIKPRVTLPLEEGIWPNSFIFDSNGNIYISAYGEMNSTVIVFDNTGKKLFDIEAENMSGSLFLIDGIVYVDSYEMGEGFKYNFNPIDIQTKKLGAPIDMTSMSSGNAIFTEDGIYLNKSGGVYTYDMNTSEQTQILSWNDTDIDLSKFSYGSMVPVSKEKMIIVSQNYYDYMESSDEPVPVKMAILTKEAINPNAGKKIITIAGLEIFSNTTITSEIYKFNKSSTDYRIEIKDYAENFDYTQFYSNKDYNAFRIAYAELVEAMYLDMINGEGPDIIMTSYSMSSLERFEAKGLLVDLYELAAKDESFNKDNFVQSVLSVYERDGKLYQFPLGFSLEGLVGPVSLIGDRTGWTVDQFNEMVNSLPEGVLPLVNVTQSALLSSCLRSSMNSFVDYTKNEVNFDNDEFYKLLDLAKTYGSDDDAEVPMYSDHYYDGIGGDGSSYVDPWELMSTGKLALSDAYIYGPSSISQFRYQFGEDVSFVGYPSADKSGMSCSVNQSFAISAESPNQDAAWQFVKGFIGEDYQSTQYYGIPVLQVALDEQIEKALHPDDENVDIMYKDMYYKDMYYGDALTQEDVEKYLELINSVSSKTEGDEQILAIILEEVPAYFNGQKTEQDVSAIIQNRVKTFVNEKS